MAKKVQSWFEELIISSNNFLSQHNRQTLTSWTIMRSFRAKNKEQISISSIIEAICRHFDTRMGQNSVGNYSHTLRIYFAKNCSCSTSKWLPNSLLINKYCVYVRFPYYFAKRCIYQLEIWIFIEKWMCYFWDLFIYIYLFIYLFIYLYVSMTT